MSKMNLVKGDTGPTVDVALKYADTGAAIDVSNAGDIVRFYMRPVGDPVLKATAVCSKPNGGADGLVRIGWAAADLDTAGKFVGELEITFNSGTIQTIYEKIHLNIREPFG